MGAEENRSRNAPFVQLREFFRCVRVRPVNWGMSARGRVGGGGVDHSLVHIRVQNFGFAQISDERMS